MKLYIILIPCIESPGLEVTLKTPGHTNKRYRKYLMRSVISWAFIKKPLNESERGERKSWLKARHSENEDHGIWSHHFMGNRWKQRKQCQTLFWGAPKSLQIVTAAMKLKDAYSLEEKL